MFPRWLQPFWRRGRTENQSPARPRARRVAPGKCRLRGEVLEDRHLLNGLTLIMHGHAESVDGWPDAMANAIRDRIAAQAAYVGASTAEYTLQLLGSTPSTITGYSFRQGANDSTVTAPQATSGETIIKVQWTNLSQIGRGNAPVGDWVAKFLLDPANEYLLSGPIHLIGFSRGAAAIATLAKDLAAHNIWIDQFTTIDPHPQPTWGDSLVTLWDNVRFADNYWQSTQGSPVTGAHNVAIPTSQLVGGNSDPHFDMPLWYIGTIDTVGSFSNKTVTIPQNTAWYAGSLGPRDQTGFYNTLIGGGNRAAGAMDGLIGVGGRTAVARVGSQWANLDSTLNVSGGSTVEHGDTISLTYRYESTADCTISFGYDNDGNPYDGAHHLAAISMPATSSSGVSDNGLLETYGLDLDGVAIGTWHVYAKIASGGHVRYVYADDLISVVDASPNAAMALAPTDSDATVSLTPTLVAAAFVDPDEGDTLHAAQWIVATDPTLQNIVWQTQTGPGATSAQVPAWTLDYDATYYWAVRYQDNLGAWSPWSNIAGAASFHTQAAGPLTVALGLAAGQTNPSGAAPIHFAATFSEPISGFSAEDVSVSSTASGTLSVSVTGSGEVYDVAVSGMTSSGTVTVRLAEGVVSDDSGNFNAQSAASGSSVLYDVDRPWANLSNPAAGASITLTQISGQKYLDVAFQDAGG